MTAVDPSDTAPALTTGSVAAAATAKTIRRILLPIVNFITMVKPAARGNKSSSLSCGRNQQL
jgi:hypothetical protein